jgi:hypothetical protein
MTRAGYLLHPVVLVGLALWLVNDHAWKAAYPSWWTGKLSDVASLAVFPLVPYAATDLWRARRGLPPPSLATLVFWIVATGLVMATIKTLGAAADCYRWGLGAAQWPIRALRGWSLPAIQPVCLTEDPTDLFALPALLVPWRVIRAQQRGSVSVASGASVAPRCASLPTGEPSDAPR